MVLTRYILFGYLAFFLICVGESAEAKHVPEDLLEDLFHEITTPACLYSNQVKGTSFDCENPDPAVGICWQKNLHRDYGLEGLTKFLEEIRLSNQKYRYYNDTLFNEIISNRNWDNLFYYDDKCKG